ncbi:hypothetical protein [Burkholderia ambifaria]|uniref:hypothetical protein n=1 Tax=Burkholderia ambifaria TaxID=152480 RepID=UPI002FE40F2F
MNDTRLTRAVGSVDLKDLLTAHTPAQYANTTVFTPPIRQDSAMLRAIEAVKVNIAAPAKPSEASPSDKK